MGSAVYGLSIMSRPQIIPKWPPCQLGPYGMGRAMTPHPWSLPQSWSMSQPLRSLLPEARCGIQACSPSQPVFSVSQPKSTGTPPPHRSPSNPGTTEASKLRFQWELDGRSRTLRHPKGQWLDLSKSNHVFCLHSKTWYWRMWSPCSPSGSFAIKTGQQWLRKLAHRRELYLVPTWDIAAAFATELLSQLRNRGTDLDRVSQVRARQDGKTLAKTSSTKFAAQIVAEYIQGWLPVRSTDPEFQHEITQLRSQLAELRQRLGEVHQRDVYLWYHCGIWPFSLVPGTRITPVPPAKSQEALKRNPKLEVLHPFRWLTHTPRCRGAFPEDAKPVTDQIDQSASKLQLWLPPKKN